MSGDDFLARWSRRKLEVRREEEVEPASADHESVPAEAAEPELTPEEIEALSQKVEEMTAETDITLFLRKGVPEMLKNAALRRMWSLDPAIRDYVSEAREYAYDWNVPGGVPGNGPLLPTDNVEAMLARVFGDARPDAELLRTADAAPQVGEPAPGPPAGAPDDAEGAEPHQDEADAEGAQLSSLPDEALPLAVRPPAGDDATAHAEKEPQHDMAVPRRRHGGAIPL